VINIEGVKNIEAGRFFVQYDVQYLICAVKCVVDELSFLKHAQCFEGCETES